MRRGLYYGFSKDEKHKFYEPWNVLAKKLMIYMSYNQQFHQGTNSR